MKEGAILKAYDPQKDKVYELDIEEYVEGAVAWAMPAHFPLEALKSQAVCCRTIAIKRMRIFGGSGCIRFPDYDICTDFRHCQGFLEEDSKKVLWGDDWPKNSEKIKKAVSDTSGLILTYNNNPIEALYHDTCGGFTEDSENVLGNKISYLRRVECGFCKDSPNYSTTKIITLKNLEKKLGINLGYKAARDEIKGIFEEVKTTGTGRIKKMKIGDREFTGDDIKELLSFPSNKFNWKIVTVDFEVMGKGHGLGMCQYGARGMALKGYSFQDILNYYFTGVEIKKILIPPRNKPLISKKIVIDPGRGSKEDLCGPMGISEGFINFEIAKNLMDVLKKEGAQVILTRNSNENKNLIERVNLINNYEPDLLISIHQYFLKPEKEKYIEIYYFPGDKESKRLSECIRKILINTLEVEAVISEADLFILRESKCPSVVIFVSNLNNPQEEKRLTDEEYRKNIVKSILSGIIQYYCGLLP
ncbi:MAG: stage II sporulation protein D [Thermovenabulum sp.]|uniref:stage II sporulation protein D n=1 Tax=Thermovenabulum sp. TaxID=3100335 RepID=UPI003C799016